MLRNKGFTLLEILIVVAILTFIGGGVIAVSGSKQLTRARDTTRKADLENLQSSLELYIEQAGCYPEELECGRPVELNGRQVIGHVPCDPKNGFAYYYESDGTNCSNWYRLYTNLEFESDKDIDIVECTQGCGPGCAYNYGVSSTNISIEQCSSVPTPTIAPTTTPTTAPTLTPTIGPTLTPSPTLPPIPTGQPAPTQKLCLMWPPPWPWWLWWLWILWCTWLGWPPPIP